MTTGQELFAALCLAKTRRDDQTVEIERLRAALRELARFGSRGGKDCWCTAPKPYDDDSVHSPGCRAARAAMSVAKPN